MNNDAIANSTSIKGLIGLFSPEQIRVIEGTVISEDPLKVQAANDEKLAIPADLLIVPQHLSDWKEEVVISTDAYNEKDVPVEEATPFVREPTCDPGEGKVTTTCTPGACTVSTSCGNPDCSVSSSFSHGVCSAKSEFMHGECVITPCAEHHYKSDWLMHRNHLRSGDVVILLALGGGSKYLIFDRKAKVT